MFFRSEHQNTSRKSVRREIQFGQTQQIQGFMHADGETFQTPAVVSINDLLFFPHWYPLVN